MLAEDIQQNLNRNPNTNPNSMGKWCQQWPVAAAFEGAQCQGWRHTKHQLLTLFHFEKDWFIPWVWTPRKKKKDKDKEERYKSTPPPTQGAYSLRC